MDTTQDVSTIPDRNGVGYYPTNGTEPKLLSAQDIIDAQDVEERIVDVPEWRGRVRVFALTAEQRDALEVSNSEDLPDGTSRMKTQNFRATVVALGLVDAKGERMFKGAEGIAALQRKSYVGLNRVFKVIAEMSALTKGDQEALEKNFEGDRGGSPSGSSPSAFSV